MLKSFEKKIPPGFSGGMWLAACRAGVDFFGKRTGDAAVYFGIGGYGKVIYCSVLKACKGI